MTALYIVKININSGYMGDGFVELSKSNSKSDISIINIRTHKDSYDKLNNTLLYKFMTSNFATFNFNDDTFICVLNYNNINCLETNTCTLIFDKISSSAYNNFKKTFKEYYNTRYETEYYKSGNIQYCGEILYGNNERVPNGNGIMYYDVPGTKIKYEGDFESGLYDGSGIFYSIDNIFSLVARNISNGIPTQKGQLLIKLSLNKTETIDIKFNDVWDKLALNDKVLKQNYVVDDNFVFNLAKLYWTNTEISLDNIVFQNKSLDDKYDELWKIIKNQELLLYNINNNINNNNNQLSNILKKQSTYFMMYFFFFSFIAFFFL